MFAIWSCLRYAVRGEAGAIMGHLVFNRVAGSLDAWCVCHQQEDLLACHMNRTLKPWKGKGRQAQGRPLGILVAWLMCATQVNREEHQEMRRHKEADDAAIDHLCLGYREHGRTVVESDPAWHAWCTEHCCLERSRRPGEGPEPEGLA